MSDTDNLPSDMGGEREPGAAAAPDGDLPPPAEPSASGETQPPAHAPSTPKKAARRPDPWAHRRAEPRTFAFIWTVYLFLATLSTYAIAMSSGIGGHDVIRPAARMLLVVVASGLVVIWPLVRLSQAPDPRLIAGPILDTVVVMVPIQAIVWPQCAWWLADWPLTVVAAVAASLACWAALIGSVMSIAHTRRARSSRFPALWMVAILAGLLLIHLPAALTAAPNPPGPDMTTQLVRPLWMLSPVLAVYEVTQDRTWIGTPAAVYAGHWRMIGLTGGVAMASWLTAAAMALREAGRRRARGLH